MDNLGRAGTRRDLLSSIFAALIGGRFSGPGIEARYLALKSETALTEYRAESPLLPPFTLVSFRVCADPVIDFSRGNTLATWSSIPAEAECNWKSLWQAICQCLTTSNRPAR